MSHAFPFAAPIPSPLPRQRRLSHRGWSVLLALAAGPLTAQTGIFEPIKPPTTQDVNTPTANAIVRTGGCTGTLIREDIVLTAAHCYPPSYDGLGIPPVVWHRVKTWFPSQNWTVEFGNDRDNPILSVQVTHFSFAFGNDLVLLALAHPVSPTVAIPIPPLLAHAPVNWSTQSFTLSGWGTIDDVGTLPRFRQRTTASNGQFPCPTAGANEICVLVGASRLGFGDSGGPLLWRDQNNVQWVIGEVQNAREFYLTFGKGNGGSLGSIQSLIAGKMTAPNPNTVLARNCLTGNRPGATLLFPYFEVDLDDPAGRSTLLSIQNRGAQKVQAHAVFWTDWGKPTLSFDLTLEAFAIQTMNLRDAFATGAGPQAAPFAACPNVVYGSTALRAAHLGDPVSFGCIGEPRPDRVATGYITVDTVLAGYCPGAFDRDPWDPRYFEESPFRRATDQNVLAGDFFLVRPNENYAQGFDAVALVADSTRSPGGVAPAASFWGKYVEFSGRDHRLPLSDAWSVRYAQGGGFDAGTDLMVWRETPDADSRGSIVSCGAAPDWLPLGERSVEQRSEAGIAGPEYSKPSFFPLATQLVSAADLTPATPFGSFLLDLGRADGSRAQAWTGVVLRATGRYSVGHSGVPTHDLCDPVGTVTGPFGEDPEAAEEGVEANWP